MSRSLLFLFSLLCLFGFSSAASVSQYQNIITSQTTCSATCNGFTTQTYQCVDTTTGLPVDSKNCPTTIPTVTCNYCASVFLYTDWTPCNSTCATPEFPVGGVQTRSPLCRVYSQVLGADQKTYVDYTFTLSTTPDVDCGAPSTHGLSNYQIQSQACNTAQCIGNTYIEQLISNTCGGECNQPGATYQQVCVNANGNPIAASNCNGLLLAGWIQNGGTVVRQCPNYVPCATKLVFTDFGICSAPCNGGVQTRNLTCHNWNPPTGTFLDFAFNGLTATGASFLTSDGQVANADTTCTAFTDVAGLSRSCNTQKCNTPFVWQCGAWGLNYALYQYQAFRTCQCLDSSTSLVVPDTSCTNNYVAKPSTTTYDLASVGLAANTLVSSVGDCNARCSIAGSVKPTRTRTYNCLNIDGTYPSGVTYAQWIVKNPECTVPGSSISTSAFFPISVTEVCNTDICTDVTWAVTYTPPCPVQCANTNQYITRTVQCMSLGSGLPTNSSNCPSISMPATSILCNTQACTYSWQYSEWGTCSQPCVPQAYFTSGAATGPNPFYAPPTQTRSVQCIRQDGVVDTSGQSCASLPVPATSRRCNFFACQESLQVVYRSDCLMGTAKCITSASLTGTKYADCYDPFGNLIPTDVKGLPAKACRDLYPNTDFTPASINCKDYLPVCAPSLQYLSDFSVCSQKCTPRTRLPTGQYMLGSVGTRTRGLPTCIGADGVTATTLDQCTTLDSLNSFGYRNPDGSLMTSFSQTAAFQTQICNVDVCADVYTWQVNQDASGNCLNPTCVDNYGNQVSYKLCLDRVDTIGSAPACVSTAPTYSWFYGIQPYGACSKQCGGGSQTRNVLCTLADGMTTSSNPTTDCGSANPPNIPTTQRCNTQACNYALKTIPQAGASCSLTCGGGIVKSVPTCVNTINGNSESILSCVNSGLLGAGDCNGASLVTRADGTIDWSTCVINAPCNPQVCNGVAGTSNSYYQWVTNPWTSCHCPASNLEQVSRTVTCYQFSSQIPTAYDPVAVLSSNCDSNSMPAVSHHCPTKDVGCAGPITYQWRISYPDCTLVSNCGKSVSTVVYCAGFQMGQSNVVDNLNCASAGQQPTASAFTCNAGCAP